MKKAIIKIFMISAVALFAYTSAFSQGPPPPPGFGEPEDQPAPIGSGLGILLALGAAYGAKKVFDARKKFKK